MWRVGRPRLPRWMRRRQPERELLVGQFSRPAIHLSCFVGSTQPVEYYPHPVEGLRAVRTQFHGSLETQEGTAQVIDVIEGFPKIVIGGGPTRIQFDGAPKEWDGVSPKSAA